MTQRDFTFFAEDDEIRVRFVAPSSLGRLPSGHAVGGDYEARTIRLPRGEYRNGLRATFMHELGHYLVDRQDLNPRRLKSKLPAGTTEEDVCDLLTWLPAILTDPRNDELRAFLGLDLS